MSRHYRRSLERKSDTRRYKKVIIISTEGSVTEPKYFGMFNTTETDFHVKVLNKGTASDPQSVLKRMKKHLKENPLRKDDQAWLVIDSDQRPESRIQPLFEWSESRKPYKFALSNPNFEYWLLLHFEDAAGIQSSQDCLNRLKKHLPEYTKNIDPCKFRPHIQTAIDRAEKQDRLPCKDWPKHAGTTVYKLAKELLRHETQPAPPRP